MRKAQATGASKMVLSVSTRYSTFTESTVQANFSVSCQIAATLDTG